MLLAARLTSGIASFPVCSYQSLCAIMQANIKRVEEVNTKKKTTQCVLPLLNGHDDIVRKWLTAAGARNELHV